MDICFLFERRKGAIANNESNAIIPLDFFWNFFLGSGVAVKHYFSYSGTTSSEVIRH